MCLQPCLSPPTRRWKLCGARLNPACSFHLDHSRTRGASRDAIMMVVSDPSPRTMIYQSGLEEQIANPAPEESS